MKVIRKSEVAAYAEAKSHHADYLASHKRNSTEVKEQNKQMKSDHSTQLSEVRRENKRQKEIHERRLSENAAEVAKQEEEGLTDAVAPSPPELVVFPEPQLELIPDVVAATEFVWPEPKKFQATEVKKEAKIVMTKDGDARAEIGSFILVSDDKSETIIETASGLETNYTVI